MANEVFRRVHPDKITIGEFIRREISSKLKVDIYLGLKEEELERVSDVKMSSWVRPLVTDLLPRSLGRADDLHLVSLGRVVWREVRRSRTGSRPAPAIEGMGPADPLVFNCPEVRRGEVPSAGVHGTGRGLARLASIMSRGGGDQDGELLSPPAWDQLHSDPVVGDMTFHTNTFTRGGLADFRPAPGDGTIDKVRSPDWREESLMFFLTDILREARGFLRLVRLWRFSPSVEPRAPDWLRLRPHTALLVRHRQQQGRGVPGDRHENCQREEERGEKMIHDTCCIDFHILGS